MSPVWIWLGSLILASASTEKPLLLNGRLDLMPAPSDLSSGLAALGTSSAQPTWAGYSVPLVAGSHHLCGDDMVRLDEDGNRDWRSRPEGEVSATLLVLYRVEGHRVTRIRPVSSRCRIDGGGRTLHWWEPVSPAGSLALLESVVSRSSDERVAEQAIHAMALHGDPGADSSLGRIAAGSAAIGVRNKALFWLGALRGEGGFPILAARLAGESNRELREQIVFSLSLSSAADATGKLIEVARRDRDSRVRERALFWLSQKAGKRAADAIASAVHEDPEIEVKKKAVFALSQLPPDEGVPLLIQVAETHPSPEVRKQAFFWLGQSDDPRALALFERILLEK